MKTGTLEEIRIPELTRPLRLLILEHAPEDIEHILLQLKESGIHIHQTLVETREGFRRALENSEFDAILADYRLPGWTGLEAFDELRALGKDIPFLLVTGTVGEEAAVESIKQGVADYVLKEHIARLPAALKRALQEKALRDESEGAHQALAASEASARRQFAELDVIYRSAPLGFAVFDRDYRYLRVNEALARSHDLLPAELVGRSVHEVIPAIAEGVAARLRQVFAGGESILNAEHRIPDADSSKPGQDFLASYYPLPAEDGRVSAVCVVVVDISERKKSEEALRVSEARNRDFVENSIYGISRVKADGTFLDGNPALLSILGCSSTRDLQALNLLRDIFRYPEQCGQLLGKCQEQGHVHAAEAEWRRRDGGMVAVRLHLRCLSLADQTESIEIVAEDVTDLRAMERQLRQAQKFEAIGELAGGVAHDFNNVVGAILGWAELGYEQNRDNPQAAERFARIREQSARAATLTRELLAFARQQVLQPRAVDLNSVTSSLVSFLDKVISKDIELKVITAPLDAVKADPAQIEQVLMNLCLNARDAMPNGGRLLIETEIVELDESYCRYYPCIAPGRYAALSVSDTGIGMDAETRDRIFEPFFTTKEHGKGTGMGLATVYGIVKQHDGFIHVYSEVGHGSLFRIYLPALVGTPDEDMSAKASAPSLVKMRGSETILLADDHESIREMARQTLMSLGYRVLSASDGVEALRLCENEAPALAILDVIMPKLGGTAAAAKLTERFDGLPVLFTSGYSRDVRNMTPKGSNTRYLQKPYGPTTLGRIVREILDEKKKDSGWH